MSSRIHVALKGLLFLLLLLLIYFLINPLLIFHFQQLGFKFDRHLVNEFLSYPGGFSDYISIFLFQFSKYRFLGALIYTLLMVAIVVLLSIHLTTLKNKPSVVLIFLPVVLLGYMITDYSFPIYYILILVFLLLFLNGYQKIKTYLSNQYLSFLPAILIMPLVYYLLGGGAFLTFSGTLLLLSLFSTRKVRFFYIPFIVFYTFLIPWISANYLFFITINDAFFNIKPFASDYILNRYTILIFLVVPASILIQLVLNRWSDKIAQSFVVQFLQYCILFTGLIILIAIPNKDKKQKIEIDYLAYTGNWKELLEKVDENPSNDRLINFQTNRALYHTGQMPYKLFHYQQMWGVDGLFLTRHFMPEILLPSTQLFIDLSYMNEAIHWANEAVSQKEYSPQIIEQLIVSHIIDHNYNSAMLYINNLKKFPFFKKRAIQLEQMVKNDDPDETMLKIRKFIPYENFIVSRLLPNADLYFLLEDHPNNKMAYEYLMSFYLLNNDLTSFARYFVMGQQFNYGKIPRIYQEALTYYMYELNIEGKPIPQIQIDNEVLADFSDYIVIQQEFEGSLVHAKPFLEKFNKTYWYYLDYASPVSLNRKIVIE